jgi:hypothetical protein
LWGALLVDDLMRCGDSKTAEELVDSLLTSPSWDWSGRQRLERLAALGWRWDRLDALRPRLAAEAPELLEELARQPSPGRHGVVHGTLQRGGKPWAHVRVGLIVAAEEELLLGRRLRPWNQRTVLGRCETDDQGRFRIEGVFDGTYLMVLSVTAEQLGGGEPLAPFGLSGEIELGPDQPERDLGVIDLRPWIPSAPEVEAALPGAQRPS